MAPKYILNYFDLAGRGEMIRIIFHAAGVEFTDNRITFEDWPAQKSDARRFPLGQMPTLEIDDKVISQSHAIGRYLARQFGFYGDNAYDAAVIDQIVETLIDYITDLTKLMYGGFDDETKKTKFAEFFASDKAKLQVGFVENILKKSNGGFFLGEKPSYADFMFYGGYLWVSQANASFLDEFSELKALVGRIENIDGVKKYLDSKKE